MDEFSKITRIINEARSTGEKCVVLDYEVQYDTADKIVHSLDDADYSIEMGYVGGRIYTFISWDDFVK